MATPTHAYSLIESIKEQKSTLELKLAKKIVELEAKKSSLRAEISGLDKILAKIVADKI